MRDRAIAGWQVLLPPLRSGGGLGLMFPLFCFRVTI